MSAAAPCELSAGLARSAAFGPACGQQLPMRPPDIIASGAPAALVILPSGEAQNFALHAAVWSAVGHRNDQRLLVGAAGAGAGAGGGAAGTGDAPLGGAGTCAQAPLRHAVLITR